MKVKTLVKVLFLLSLVVMSTWFSNRPATLNAQEPNEDNINTQAVVGTTFTYQGRLTDSGNPANGMYDFEFKLYDALTGGSQVGGTVTKDNLNVSGGIFTTELDFGSSAFTGDARWLQIGVRPGNSSGAYTTLSPRQPLNATPYALYASSTGNLHLPFSGVADDGNTAFAVINEASATAIYGRSAYWTGVYGISEATSESGKGVWGVSEAISGTGVQGHATATSGTTYGVNGWANSPSGFGGYFVNASTDGVALYATGNGATKNKATLRVDNTEPNGGMATWMLNSSNFANAHFQNDGVGGVLFLENGSTVPDGSGGGDFITAINHGWNDLQFRVTSSGEVRSDVGFFTPAADFAEMLPAVEGLEAGDVLVISADGKLTRSTEAYQSSVVGVYSTQPGFVGGQPVEEELEDHIPLAVIGVAPVKASTENGPIQPCDLLVASATPGHAMKAEDDPPNGTVIGKALQPLAGDVGVIQMLVMLQ